LFVSKVGEGGVMAWPRILHRWWGDLYVAPNGQDRGTVQFTDVPEGQASTPTRIELPDGSSAVAQLVFRNFVLDPEAHRSVAEGRGMPDQIQIGASAMLAVNGDALGVFQPSLSFSKESTEGPEPSPVPVTMPWGATYFLLVTDVKPEGRTASFSLV